MMIFTDRYIYKHAVIVGIDGMGNFNKDTETPNMDRIFESGAQTLYALSMYPTISAQNWGAMLLGVNPEVHCMTNGSISANYNEDDNLPSLFREIRKKYPEDVLCSYCNWDPINHGIVEHNLDVDMQTANNDEILCGMIEKAIEKKPKFLFIQFDDVDGGGHGSGYGTQGHFDTIKKADEYVGRVYDAYKKAGIIEDTLFTVIADHGGYDHGHGGYSEGEKYIYLACAGKTVNNIEIPFAQAKDINAIIRHGLGLDVPAYEKSHYSAQIPENLFSDYEKEYIKIKPVPFGMINEPTPGINAEDGLLSFFGKDDLKLAMFFDNKVQDELGKIKLNLHGRAKFYTNGRYGSMGELGEIGWLTTEDIKFGTDSFSAGVWLKIDKSIQGNCYLFGTKAMRADSRGFMACMTAAGTMLALENDNHESYNEIITPFIDEISDGWIHFLFCFDKKEMEVKVYHNFELKRCAKIDKAYDINYDNMPFTIGNECSFKGNNEWYDRIFNLDDLFIFNKSLNEDEVKKYASYYKM